ncbi:hypothetical protein [Tabrizicola aquatica]|uniref:hypothetical protein n=1 Tax=Tabrizicola aquatica TaxID=909926 RepID=UPI000CD1F4E7|nr:hypothetical protein [Tabrizicola aquatica]
MDPDAGLGIEPDNTAGARRRPRPSLLVRGLEMVGLGLVIYGLATSGIWLAALGGGLILGSYALYRRTHGSGLDRGRGVGPDGPDAADAGE